MKLLILGAGEYGHLVKELAKNKYEIIDFLDDNSVEAIGKLDKYQSLKDEYKNAVVAIGNPEVRMMWIRKLLDVGYTIPTLISNQAYVSPSAIIDLGCIIEPMAVIHTGAKIGKGTIISTGAVINHNSVVEDGCHIDCNAVVGADAHVTTGAHLEYCGVIKRKD